MTDYRQFFKGKKITVMGLGLLGGAVNDAAYLAKRGADLTVTDLKTREALKASVLKLKKYENIKFVLGKHRLEDFKKADMILQPGNVPLNSPYLLEAKKNHIPVFVSESLFARYMPEVTLIGVTGTRGKSTTTALIYEILSQNLKGRKIFMAGNVKNVSTLALLDKVQTGDVVVLELDSWAAHGLGDIKKSPHVSVFTNLYPDHMNFYKGDMQAYFADKAFIYTNQKKNDFIIIGPKMKNLVKKTKGKKIIAKISSVPKNWKINIPGEHNLENIACALEVAKIFKIPLSTVKKSVESFRAIEGRMELVRSVRGVKIYNDTNSTTPEATIAAIRALGNKKKKNIVLIIGGDKKFLDMSGLVKEIPKWCSKVIMFRERGTELVREEVLKMAKKGIEVYEAEGLPATVKRAFSVSKKGEILLYSPAFSSFGKYFSNEYDRGDQFMKIVKELK